MPSTPPFIDPETGDLDLDRVMYEAVPIAKLVTLVGGVALVPFALAALAAPTAVAGLFVLATQFVLAVGSGVVLLYVVRRALQLADDEGGGGDGTDDESRRTPPDDG
ncbi:hypothetical protein [Halostella litorea]|uniref:hypothetical protein n=1 Tax=Halostella litorea TaxID=2528831 RepID=UPI0010931CF2|nr:hypothetical protein [Halostella litorea]